jgi:hypothetical protein
MVKLITLLSIIFMVFSCTQKNNDLIIRYEKLHNSHDIDEVMKLFHNDITFELIGTWIKSGKKEIRELEEWDSALNSNLTFKSISIHKDSIFYKVVEKNDWFKGVGIDELFHDPTIFIVKDDKILKIIANPNPETGKKIHKAIQSLYYYSNTARDSTINDLIVDGEFIYSKTAANKWKIIFKDWKDFIESEKN